MQAVTEALCRFDACRVEVNAARDGAAFARGTTLRRPTGVLLALLWGLSPAVQYTTATAQLLLTRIALLILAAILFEGTLPGLSVSQIGFSAWLSVGGAAAALGSSSACCIPGLPAIAVSRPMLPCALVATALRWLLAKRTLSPLQPLGAALRTRVGSATRTTSNGRTHSEGR